MEVKFSEKYNQLFELLYNPSAYPAVDTVLISGGR